MCLNAVELGLILLSFGLHEQDRWMALSLPCHKVINEIALQLQEKKKLTWQEALSLPSPRGPSDFVVLLVDLSDALSRAFAGAEVCLVLFIFHVGVFFDLFRSVAARVKHEVESLTALILTDILVLSWRLDPLRATSCPLQCFVILAKCGIDWVLP